MFKKPIGNSFIGRRSKNEDYAYPDFQKASRNATLFIVCDGVGGANKGDVASRLTALSFAGYIEKRQGEISESLLKEALSYAEDALVECESRRPECQGMATTLVALAVYQNNKSCMVGWVGDSRLYHIREGKILYRTKDHSLVELLVEQGEISSEEARSHSLKNRILRAVQAGESTDMDVHTIHDVQKGDYFLLCSDGLLEAFTDMELEGLIKNHNSLLYIQQVIEARCAELSTDNYTYYLLQTDIGF